PGVNAAVAAIAATAAKPPSEERRVQVLSIIVAASRRVERSTEGGGRAHAEADRTAKTLRHNELRVSALLWPRKVRAGSIREKRRACMESGREIFPARHRVARREELHDGIVVVGRRFGVPAAVSTPGGKDAYSVRSRSG
ncbi:MAG: hypothetical protein KC645_18110, partial [Gemmatimonadetes bacterium]|nr:hypothetical protein [Gemmatimonadota bacterium]